LALYDKRNPVRISTGIRILDDPRGVRAATVVAKLDAELQKYWKDKRRGRDRDGEARYEQACNRVLCHLLVPLATSGRVNAFWAVNWR